MFFLQYSFGEFAYSIPFNDLWLITIAGAQQRDTTLHNAEDQPRFLFWLKLRLTVSGKIEDDLKWRGLKQVPSEFLLLVDLKLNLFFLSCWDGGCFRVSKDFIFRKREFEMLRIWCTMLEIWQSISFRLGLGFALHHFKGIFCLRRGLSRLPPTSTTNHWLVDMVLAASTGLEDRILPTIQKHLMLISISFEPLESSGALYLWPFKESSLLFYKSSSISANDLCNKTLKRKKSNKLQKNGSTSTSYWYLQNIPGIIAAMVSTMAVLSSKAHLLWSSRPWGWWTWILSFWAMKKGPWLCLYFFFGGGGILRPSCVGDYVLKRFVFFSFGDFTTHVGISLMNDEDVTHLRQFSKICWCMQSNIFFKFILGRV